MSQDEEEVVNEGGSTGAGGTTGGESEPTTTGAGGATGRDYEEKFGNGEAAEDVADSDQK